VSLLEEVRRGRVQHRVLRLDKQLNVLAERQQLLPDEGERVGDRRTWYILGKLNKRLRTSLDRDHVSLLLLDISSSSIIIIVRSDCSSVHGCGVLESTSWGPFPHVATTTRSSSSTAAIILGLPPILLLLLLLPEPNVDLTQRTINYDSKHNLSASLKYLTGWVL
jgi:hypothetical protein